MTIGPKVASCSVPTMISTPFPPSARPARPVRRLGPMPARAVEQRLIGREGLALGGDTDPHAADFALVRDIARLDFHHQRKAGAGDRRIQRAPLAHQHFVGQRHAGIAQQRLAVEFGQFADCRWAARSRGIDTATSGGGAKLKRAQCDHLAQGDGDMRSVPTA